MKYLDLFESSIKKIEQLRPQLAKAAQEVYDTWEQNDDGFDEELGYGGICQDIADAMANVLAHEGFDLTIVDSQGVGEQHVWIVVKTDEGVFSVDIPPYVYETGGGFNWKKKHEVEIDPSDVELYHISVDPNDFNDYIN